MKQSTLDNRSALDLNQLIGLYYIGVVGKLDVAACLKPVHTGDSVAAVSATIAENSDCRRKRQLSQKSATALSRATVALFCDSVDRALT